MPLVLADRPTSPRQRRFNRVALVSLCCTGIVLGLWQAYTCAKIPYGYVAGYSLGIAYVLAIVLAVLGLPFVVYWRTRWMGLGFLLAGFLSCLVFYAGLSVLVRLDRVAWRHERLVHFGPDQEASVVIYFCPNTTDAQIENFAESVLEEDAKPGHSGRDFPTFVAEYLRLSPAQAYGHKGVALTFRNIASQEAIRDYLTKIKSDPRIARVFTDVAPTAIRAEDAHSVGGSCR